MVSKEEIVKLVLQSAIIETIVEKRMAGKVGEALKEKLARPDYETRENLKEIILDILNDKDVKEKIKKIGGTK
jgi:hypothetical protein